MSYLIFVIILWFSVGYAKVNYTKEVKVEKEGIAFLHCLKNKEQDVTWLRANKDDQIRIHDTPGKYKIFPNGKLKITNVTFLDVGVYQCRIAGNILNNHLFKLSINAETINATAESNVVMSCQAEIPREQSKVSVRFFAIDSNNSRTVIKDNGRVIKKNCERCDSGGGSGAEKVLQINGIRKRYEGKYLCTVKWESNNHKGHSEYFFYVQVNELKTIESKSTTKPATEPAPKKIMNSSGKITKDTTKPATEPAPKKIMSSSGKITKDTWYLAALMSILPLILISN